MKPDMTQEFQLPQGAEWLNKSKGIYIYRIQPHTQAWYDFRLTGLGGSDTGSVMGLNDYIGGSSLELFHQKIGNIPPRQDSNKYTFFGNYWENSVADLWRYHNGEDFIENYVNGNKLRDCQNVNGIVKNVKYPWLFANVDRLMNQGSFKLTDGSIMDFNAILECKTASSWMKSKWETVDPKYVVQVVQYMLVFGVDYAEIAIMFLDNREVQIFPVELNDSVAEQVLEQSHHFWYDMVEPAKELMAQIREAEAVNDNKEVQRLQQEVDRYEPAADGTESYKEFMNKRWLSEPDEVIAEPNIIMAAEDLMFVKDLIKDLNGIKTYKENQIREVLRDKDTLDCMDWGKITWKTNSRGSRVLSTRGFKSDTQEIVEEARVFIQSKFKGA